MIRDFHCTYDNFPDISKEMAAGLELNFPDAYLHGETMAKLSLHIKESQGAKLCELPFCHTVESEAMGAIINMGDEKQGPRGKTPVCTSIAELIDLPEIDFSKGRIREVLTACKILKRQGEHVVLFISGPFVILDSLIDLKHIYKAMKNCPDRMELVFQKLEEELLRFISHALICGVDIISYADPSGGVGILGPKRMEQVIEEFTYPFIKKAMSLTENRALLLLCPKTTIALTDMGKATYVTHELAEPMSYQEACVKMVGKVGVAGQMCIKNHVSQLEINKFKELKILD